ncbi:MAG TPA: hypothetical protein VFS20_14800 [Longimicrobium sp.]|nr:hypothetical protein [Longimicrobium sp.]
MALSSTEQAILTSLGAPLNAKQYMIFDQSAHLDYDWVSTFQQYYGPGGGGSGGSHPPVRDTFNQAMQLLSTQQLDAYSICEMDYFREWVHEAAGAQAAVEAVESMISIVGGGITSPDNLVCAGEAFIRNYLVGKLWLASVFPDLLPLEHGWLPDDFGLDPELPVTLVALGLRTTAFERVPGTYPSTTVTALQQAMYDNGIDFRWQASDGSTVLAHFLQGGYCQGSGDHGATFKNIQDYIQSYTMGQVNGARTPYLYVPNDCDFQSPNAKLLRQIAEWNRLQPSPADVWVVNASFAVFAELVEANAAAQASDPLSTVQFNGTPYWTGYYASRMALKVLHYQATRDLLAAEALAVTAAGAAGESVDEGTQAALLAGWDALSPSTHHDYICGTAPDTVTRVQQLPELAAAAFQAGSLLSAAIESLAGAVGSSPETGEIAVLLANPVGTAANALAQLPSPAPEGIQGVRFGETVLGTQLTWEGGLLIPAELPSLGYEVGYLTTEAGTNTATVSCTPVSGGYMLANEYLQVTISPSANWGISSLKDLATGNEILSGTGNDLAVYTDGGDIYAFGYEYGSGPAYFSRASTTTRTISTAVLESGPLRARFQAVVAVTVNVPCAHGGTTAGQTVQYTREYALCVGEPFVRMSTTGAAPQGAFNPGFSVIATFPLAGGVTTLVQGTANHWTASEPQHVWNPPVFQPTHRFVLPQAGAGTGYTAAIYHADVPAWAYDSDGVTLMGCLFRNTPGGNRGANGTDPDVHTVRYALRVPSGLGDPTTGQPLTESLVYATPPVAVLVPPDSRGTLPEAFALAEVSTGTGVIMAAKPGDVTPGTFVLRIYQPTNAEQTLEIATGLEFAQADAVTALEDPIEEGGPGLDFTEDGISIDMPYALATVQLTV